MKKFLRTVLAVIAALIVVDILAVVIMLGIISSASAGKSQPVIPSTGVLAIDMSQLNIAEQTKVEDQFSSLMGGLEARTIGIWQATKALEYASQDPGVKFVMIKTDGASGGLATLQEFRRALTKFRATGKPVVAYIESPTTASYYLASVADKVYMTSNEGATTMVTGIGSQMIFLKDLLDKLGVNVQLIRHGKYKSAGEMYIRNSPSQENLDQYKDMIDAVWSSYASEIAASRDLSEDQVNEVIDGLQLNFPEDFVKAGFVDELLTREELKAKVADLAVAQSFKDVKFIPFADYAELKANGISKAKKKIAIVYADGEIVDGKATQGNISGDALSKVIAGVRADSTIKAVVFRINSPGGSVLASDKIRTEVDLLRKAKPVIASYGDYAASGGYWISSSCDKIYSDPTTLTGSIGVFSMIPDFSKTASDLLHVNITTVGSNEHADMYSLTRPLSESETAYMQASVERIYDKFVHVVADGRDMMPEAVDSIAQGRVWAGSRAIHIGLVDEMGTLEDAVRYAAVTGGDEELSDWKVEEFPKPLSPMEEIMAMLQQNTNSAEDFIFEGTPFESTAKAFLKWSRNVKDNREATMFARLPYCIDMK